MGVHHALVRPGDADLALSRDRKALIPSFPDLGSSRAFPSSLIDGDRANSTPVLFPGIDLLNHRPTAKVTWSTDVHAAPTNKGAEAVPGSLTIVLDEAVSAGNARPRSCQLHTFS